jgi:hypothetical protein
VQVRSGFRRGSFGIDLRVVQSLLEQAKGLLLGDNVKAAQVLLELVGITGTGNGLIKLVKWIGKRRMPTATPIEKGMVRLEIEGNSFELPADVLHLFNDREIRASLRGVLRPLERDGIDVFQIRRNNRVVETITKSEVSLFEDPTQEERVIYEGDRIAAFEVVTASFEERYKWRLSDGEVTFTADIEDEEFFRREVFFGKGDVLEVKLHTRSWQTGDGLRTEHKILEVRKIIPATRQQIPLLPSSD